jgi:hypothetical protein
LLQIVLLPSGLDLALETIQINQLFLCGPSGLGLHRLLAPNWWGLRFAPKRR